MEETTYFDIFWSMAISQFCPHVLFSTPCNKTDETQKDVIKHPSGNSPAHMNTWYFLDKKRPSTLNYWNGTSKNRYLGCLGVWHPLKNHDKGNQLQTNQQMQIQEQFSKESGVRVSHVDATKHLKLVVNFVVCLTHPWYKRWPAHNISFCTCQKIQRHVNRHSKCPFYTKTSWPRMRLLKNVESRLAMWKKNMFLASKNIFGTTQVAWFFGGNSKGGS